MRLQRAFFFFGTISVRGVERYQDLEIKLTGFWYFTVTFSNLNVTLIVLKFSARKIL